MKLYFADRRTGVRIQTFRKPPIAPNTTPEYEAELASVWPEFWNPNLRWPDGQLLTFNQQFALIVYYVKMGVFTYGLGGSALKFFVTEKMALIVPAAGWKIVSGMFVWLGVVILAFYILDPPIKESTWEDNYGSRWLMRYNERLWWAKYAGFWDFGMPIFQRLDEIGEVIAFEYRAVVRPKMSPDRWKHLDSWHVLKRPHVLWNHYIWQNSSNIFQGLCVQVERDFYGVQKSYHPFLIPESKWT